MIIVGKVNGLSVLKVTDAELTIIEAVLSDDSEQPAPAPPRKMNSASLSNLQMGQRKKGSRKAKSEHKTATQKLTEAQIDVIGPYVKVDPDQVPYTTLKTASAKEYCTLTEAANRTGFPDHYFRRAVHNERIAAFRLSSDNTLLVRHSDVDALISLLREADWKPVSNWNPKVPGSWRVTVLE